MTKLASVVDTIVNAVKSEQDKLAAATLSKNNSSPTISTELGQALQKTAELIRSAAGDEVSFEDLQNFIERARNA